MKLFVNLLVVIPIGPTCTIEFVLDTISSVMYYVQSDKKIIIVDDSQIPEHEKKIKDLFPDVVILKNRKSHGKLLGLYISLCHAYSYALDHFTFDALLRLDTDALIIGHSPESQIFEFFKSNPNVGLAGRYVKGVASPDDFGNVWMNGGRELIVAIIKIFTRYYVRHPFIYWKIRKILFKAINQGYELGELVFGGAYAFSYIGLKRLQDNGLLPLKNVLGAELEEDHFFTLLISYVGLDLGDLASGELPFGCTWQGLPASPETLCEKRKKIIHSTRFWKDMNEEEIRSFFRARRQQE